MGRGIHAQTDRGRGIGRRHRADPFAIIPRRTNSSHSYLQGVRRAPEREVAATRHRRLERCRRRGRPGWDGAEVHRLLTDLAMRRLPDRRSLPGDRSEEMVHSLITGGAGFIGSHLVEALVTYGEHARVLDDFSTGKRGNLQAAVLAAQAAGSLQVIEGDVRDLGTVRQAMAGVDCVVHLAAIVSVQQSMADPLTTHAVNVTGTLNVLEAAREANVKRVVLASSCAIYGDSDDLPLQETALPRPLSPYAASKLAGELYCQAFSRAYGLPTTCLRYFNVYGPRHNPNGDYAAVIPRFVARMQAGQPPVIYGDGEQTRDFVYVGDVVRATLLACEADGFDGQVFNVASGQRVSLLELVDTLNGLLDTHLAPQFEAERVGDVRHSAGGGGRLAAALGYRVETSLAGGLKKLLD
jgi:UDP-glucose 4-epimerase